MSNDGFMTGPYIPEVRRRKLRPCDGCNHKYYTHNLQLEPITKKRYCKACIFRLEVHKKTRWESGDLIATQKQSARMHSSQEEHSHARRQQS